MRVGRGPPLRLRARRPGTPRRHNGAASMANPMGISSARPFCAKVWRTTVRGLIMSKSRYALCAALLIAVQPMVLATGSPVTRAAPLGSDDGIVRVRSAHGFADTVERLRSDIAAKGILMFAVLDQRQLGAEAGVDLRPSTLLLFGNPTLGGQFLTSNPVAGLDWPVRLLVYEDAGGPSLAELHGFCLDRPPAWH